MSVAEVVVQLDCVSEEVVHCFVEVFPGATLVLVEDGTVALLAIRAIAVPMTMTFAVVAKDLVSSVSRGVAPASVLVLLIVFVKDGAVFGNVGSLVCMSLLNMTVTVAFLNSKIALQAV